MECPHCFTRGKCLDSRPSREPLTRRRRYQCPKCKRRYTTLEKVVAFDAGIPSGRRKRRDDMAPTHDGQTIPELLEKSACK